VRQRRIVVTAIAYDLAYAISRGEACHVEFEAAVCRPTPFHVTVTER
jgi:hypothetical protein